jgi:hypothetical protein
LKIVKEEEWKDLSKENWKIKLQGKLENKITRNPTGRSEVESLVDESNILLNELWAKTMGASN